jgi:hypothetical protein
MNFTKRDYLELLLYILLPTFGLGAMMIMIGLIVKLFSTGCS